MCAAVLGRWAAHAQHRTNEIFHELPMTLCQLQCGLKHHPDPTGGPIRCIHNSGTRRWAVKDSDQIAGANCTGSRINTPRQKEAIRSNKVWADFGPLPSRTHMGLRLQETLGWVGMPPKGGIGAVLINSQPAAKICLSWH